MAILSLVLGSSEVYPIVARWRKGYPQYLRRVPKGRTITVVVSSGVGKSTFVNSLLGDDWLETDHVNEVTGKGRHLSLAPDWRWILLVDSDACHPWRHVKRVTKKRHPRSGGADSL